MESNAVSLWSRKARKVKFSPNKPAKWPKWALAVSKLKKECEMGVGDTVERIIGPTASAMYQNWYKSLFKKPCGCGGRKTRWNKLYPYKP